MKSVLIIPAVVTMCCISQPAYSQGNLTPSGAPAPTMKTLAQVEPRIAITNTTAATIGASGSYYLTTNITVSTGNAISINVSGVTLDLNGFTISSTATSANGTAILLASGLTDITILNGHIASGVTYNGSSYTGPGFANGISYSGTAPLNVRVAGVSVSGALGSGIVLGTGNSTVADSCTVQTVGSYGIYASSVTRSRAYQCGNAGIVADTASDCYGVGTSGGDGVHVYQTATGCFGQSVGGYGLYANTALNCSGVSSNGAGIHAVATAENCYGVSASTTGYSGLYAFMALNCYGINSGTGSADGLDAAQTATGCYGQSINGTGLQANNAENCSGVSSTGTGLQANNAENCTGISSNGIGLAANQTATGCYGQSSGSGVGVQVSQNATGCFGQSINGNGLDANTALNCSGASTNQIGLFAYEIAVGCYGNGGEGIEALLANSCYSTTGDSFISFAYNMP